MRCLERIPGRGARRFRAGIRQRLTAASPAHSHLVADFSPHQQMG